MELQGKDNTVLTTEDEQHKESSEPQESTEPMEQIDKPPSPEPESGIGKDVDSEMDPNGDLGKGDDLKELEKPKANENIMDHQPSPNTSEDEDEGKEPQVVSMTTATDKPKPTSKPPRFDNSVEPIEYDVPVRRAPRGGGVGGHLGRGPRKAVVIIVVVSVIAVALVVGLVLAGKKYLRLKLTLTINYTDNIEVSHVYVMK